MTISALAMKRKKKPRVIKWTGGDHSDVLDFEMPKFGISPGPSPTRTPPSTPGELSESEVSVTVIVMKSVDVIFALL